MKKLFKRLRKSHSVHNDTRHRSPGPSTEPTTSNGGPHIVSSKTFDISQTRHCRFRTTDECRSYMDATSSTAADEIRDDPELDRSIMQTITDVKYVKRRPKFTAVVDANFQRQCLEAHNVVRAKYGQPPLLWSQELADLAKTWAMKLADRGRILYPELPGIGENIHLVPNESDDHLTTGEELVALWAAEAEFFDFDKPKWSIKCKNFTQMIWRASIEMGVSRFWNTTKNCLAIVSFYRPSGNSNAPGDFAANIPSRSSLPEDIKTATQLEGITQALSRSMGFTDYGNFQTRASSVPRS
uniref:SCP domain-containing protein n=1 Tax=Acrobeloides nanus TaxID=290746 RepID=A0A914E485_9BILA